MYSTDAATELLLLLNYFSLFSHPLKQSELYRLAGNISDKKELAKKLEYLIGQGRLQSRDGFYFLPGEEKNIPKRLSGAQRASRLLPKAKKTGRLIALFPFVRLVGISGSLSKGYADEKTDFDFFIVTRGNTLWICRSLLHLFKKLTFLVSRQDHFCMNYFIDENHLQIEEQNLFTRIELSTLIPVQNQKLYSLLVFRNRHNLPNLSHLPDYDEAAALQLDRKQSTQNKWAIGLNLILMWITDRKWKRKWRKRNYPMENYALAFKTTPYVSKNHPKNFQQKVLTRLQYQKKNNYLPIDHTLL